MTFFLEDISKSSLTKINYAQIFPCKNTPKSVMTFFLVTTSKFSLKCSKSSTPPRGEQREDTSPLVGH